MHHVLAGWTSCIRILVLLRTSGFDLLIDLCCIWRWDVWRDVMHKLGTCYTPKVMVHVIISVIYNILLNHCYNWANTSTGIFNTKLHIQMTNGYSLVTANLIRSVKTDIMARWTRSPICGNQWSPPQSSINKGWTSHRQLFHPDWGSSVFHTDGRCSF